MKPRWGASNLTVRQWQSWMDAAYRPSYNVAPSHYELAEAGQPQARSAAVVRPLHAVVGPAHAMNYRSKISWISAALDVV